MKRRNPSIRENDDSQYTRKRQEKGVRRYVFAVSLKNIGREIEYSKHVRIAHISVYINLVKFSAN